MTTARPLAPDEGRAHDAGAARMLVKAGAVETGGALFVCETVLDPGFPGPPRHLHRRMHDLFYVLEGTLTIELDGAVHRAGPGTFAAVPPGVVHTFRNESDEPVRLLNLATPAGFEQYMEDLAAAAQDGPLTPERIGPIASRYDVVPV